MNNNLTELVLVCDRSGSMSSCREEAEGGINRFIEEQKKAEGDTNLTLVQFDDQYDMVHDNAPIRDVGEYNLKPRAMTALLDAVGKTISTVGDRLSNTAEADRPSLVVFVVATDGNENSSSEFKKEQVAKMVKEQTDKYNWQFQFLGANIDAFAAGRGIGVSHEGTTNLLAKNTGKAYDYLSAKVGNMRSAAASGKSISAQNVWSDEERKDLESE